MKLLLRHAKIITPKKIIKGNLLINGDKIEKILKNDELKTFDFSDIETIDLKGKILGPAFIDVHIHGANGADVMDGTEEALKKISEFLAKTGTANFLATTLTSSKENLKNVLNIVANLQNKDIGGANIFGIHMEGPYFSEIYKGAQNAKYMKSAGIGEIEEYINIKKDLIKLFSISPHNQENLDAIKFLVKNDIIVSVGHSGAFFEEVEMAVKYGLSHATHTYNGMKGFTHREPGVVGAIFNFDEIMAEIIFDKVHVHPEAVRTLIKIKGVDKVICITDSMSATGLEDGQYKLGELDVILKSGEVRLISNNSLAGSALTMDRALKNLIDLDYTIIDAFKMCSTNAALEFKLNTGIIEKDKDADIVVLDKKLDVYMTVVKGKVKYIKK